MVYGSVSRGTATAESDIDLLLIIENLPNGRMPRIDTFFDHVENPFLDPIRFENREYPLRISPILKTPAEVKLGSLLFLDMTETCDIYHDRDNFFSLYLESLIEKMRLWGSEKRQAGGGYYWHLKPNLKLGEEIDL